MYTTCIRCPSCWICCMCVCLSRMREAVSKKVDMSTTGWQLTHVTGNAYLLNSMAILLEQLSSKQAHVTVTKIIVYLFYWLLKELFDGCAYDFYTAYVGHNRRWWLWAILMEVANVCDLARQPIMFTAMTGIYFFQTLNSDLSQTKYNKGHDEVYKYLLFCYVYLAVF